ncbi:MAG: hypothetical protein JRG84_20310 [Deltaproteobacteria bacterium]|nr:hypothetical protein [Deltaproteobacteria bacterium]
MGCEDVRGGLAAFAAFACLAGCSPDAAEVAGSDAAPAPSHRGFVATDFTFEQPASAPNACPQGFNLDEREHYLAGLTAAERAAAVDLPQGLDYLRMMRARGRPDPCDEPKAFEDLGHLVLDGPGVAAGFDLDGVTSTRENSGPEACPHEDFSSASGAPGFDNALWRVLGCIRGYQRGSTIDEYAIENIKSGARTILIEITDLDDLRDDDDVGLGIYSSSDLLPAAADGRPLSGGSLSVTEALRFHNTARGVLKDGVLSAGPIDLRLDFKGQFLESELHLRDARVRLELTPDGGLRGLIGGYWAIEEFYDVYARQATTAGAYTVGFRCPALHSALVRAADRSPDAETGACTAVSTAFRIEAIPAFVVQPPPSTNTQASTEAF